jgi:hypothetical protein
MKKKERRRKNTHECRKTQEQKTKKKKPTKQCQHKAITTPSTTLPHLHTTTPTYIDARRQQFPKSIGVFGFFPFLHLFHFHVCHRLILFFFLFSHFSSLAAATAAATATVPTTASRGRSCRTSLFGRVWISVFVRAVIYKTRCNRVVGRKEKNSNDTSKNNVKNKKTRSKNPKKNILHCPNIM